MPAATSVIISLLVTIVTLRCPARRKRLAVNQPEWSALSFVLEHTTITLQERLLSKLMKTI